MRITSDPDVCTGAGQCVLTEPGVFTQDARGVVELRTDRAEGELVPKVRQAVFICPSGALSVEED
ncbi:ferredoxin [Streptomyces sp. GESEQ-35]|uniref:ferredoxin n=1 Tax=Streptomyces sp. GESEQ-35 TaxID=2812657 RepID=UPI001B326913|nr:(4Fe-4S)-binding protein [Streptomyces sp. GESEQ-35]